MNTAPLHFETCAFAELPGDTRYRGTERLYCFVSAINPVLSPAGKRRHWPQTHRQSPKCYTLSVCNSHLLQEDHGDIALALCWRSVRQVGELFDLITCSLFFENRGDHRKPVFPVTIRGSPNGKRTGAIGIA